MGERSETSERLKCIVTIELRSFPCSGLPLLHGISYSFMKYEVCAPQAQELFLERKRENEKVAAFPDTGGSRIACCFS